MNLIFVVYIQPPGHCISLRIAGSVRIEISIGRKGAANQRGNVEGFNGKCQSALDEGLSKVENALFVPDTRRLPKAIGNSGRHRKHSGCLS